MPGAAGARHASGGISLSLLRRNSANFNSKYRTFIKGARVIPDAESNYAWRAEIVML
jgi:hypothetical protein